MVVSLAVVDTLGQVGRFYYIGVLSVDFELSAYASRYADCRVCTLAFVIKLFNIDTDYCLWIPGEFVARLSFSSGFLTS